LKSSVRFRRVLRICTVETSAGVAPAKNPTPFDTDELLRLASQGDNDARQRLLDRHRGRLRRMVAVRVDRRLSARVDPSDVVQEALADASQQLDDYLRDRPLAFYPWLRRFAWERLVALYWRHVLAGKRSVTREQRDDVLLSDQSAHIPGLRPRAVLPSDHHS
jgi:RNA polymerase sigma-70 factor (ECF subfamily)